MTTETTFPSIVRTERGLTVGGRRVTLYLLEDHFRAGWPPELVKDVFRLSDQELSDVIGYIAANRAEFNKEYDIVVQQAEQNRKWWEERSRPLIEAIKKTPPTSEVAAKRAKLEELRHRRSQ